VKWEITVKFTIDEPHKRNLESAQKEAENIADCWLDAIGYPIDLSIEATAVGEIVELPNE
jgi:hypothetical protein